MTQFTLVTDDGKIRIGDRVIAFHPNISSEVNIDLTHVHAIQYDADTGKGRIEWKPSAHQDPKWVERHNVGSEVGIPIKDVFERILSNTEASARAVAPQREAVSSGTALSDRLNVVSGSLIDAGNGDALRVQTPEVLLTATEISDKFSRSTFFNFAEHRFGVDLTDENL